MSYTFQDLGSEVLLIEDLLDADTCQQAIEISEHVGFESAKVLMGAVDESVRRSGILNLDRRDPILRSTNAILLQGVSVIQEALYRWYGIRFDRPEPCSILRYGPGQQYKRHVDNILLTNRFVEVEQGLPTRDVSIVGYLNDDFEGGETFFDRQNLTIQPKRGSVIVFPAYYTHPHQALPVRSGQKYAWTTWLYH